uniref:PH01B001G05.6 protein n=1 Tax=Phyllostachys edulis TaxID=38705 RepID=L0P3M0_PHYED|nr:PH01B001G05.6 [Phyllostachys edulis]
MVPDTHPKWVVTPEELLEAQYRATFWTSRAHRYITVMISCDYSDLAMDNLDKLAVRFHFSGDLFNDGKRLHYCRGRDGMSYIDQDKLSLLEVKGHLKDHCEDVELVLMHWLFPGKVLKNGLGVLTDDKDCQTMANYITDGGVVDIFIEAVGVDVGSNGVGDKEDEDSDWEDEVEAWLQTYDDDEAVLDNASKEVEVIPMSPAETEKDITCKKKFYNALPDRKGNAQVVIFQAAPKDCGFQADSNTGSDCHPGDAETSEDDEEAAESRKRYR